MLAVFFALRLAKLAAERKRRETLAQKEAEATKLRVDVQAARAAELELQKLLARHTSTLSDMRLRMGRIPPTDTAKHAAAVQAAAAAEKSVRDAEEKVQVISTKAAAREDRLGALLREVDALKASVSARSRMGKERLPRVQDASHPVPAAPKQPPDPAKGEHKPPAQLSSLFDFVCVSRHTKIDDAAEARALDSVRRQLSAQDERLEAAGALVREQGYAHKAMHSECRELAEQMGVLQRQVEQLTGSGVKR
jgi:hypothetical protein